MATNDHDSYFRFLYPEAFNCEKHELIYGIYKDNRDCYYCEKCGMIFDIGKKQHKGGRF